MQAHLPILVGVTGHRTIAPVAADAVKAGLRAALRALKAALGENLVLVTALAEGADQLAAQVAMELGIPLAAVSPMPLDQYQATMDSHAEFDRLWKLPVVRHRIVLPLVREAAPAEQDAAQFEQLGLVLSRQSHILLALWDGVDQEPAALRTGPIRATRGGSAHVVAMRQWGERGEVAESMFRDSALFSGMPPLLELARSGPILHVVTPRRDGGACQDAMGQSQPPGSLHLWSDIEQSEGHSEANSSWSVIWPWRPKPIEEAPERRWQGLEPDEIRHALPRAFERMRLASTHVAGRVRLLERRQSWLCGDRELVGEREHPALRQLRHYFDLADADATTMQLRLFGSWLPGLGLPKKGWPVPGLLFVFALCVPLLTLLFEVFVASHRMPILLAWYMVVAILPALFYLLVVRRNDWQGRYQDHRALAEGLRVQFFWAACGLPVAVSDNYLRYQTGTLGWIRLALRGPALAGMEAALAAPPIDPGFVMARWIKDQMDYFKRESAKQAIASVQLNRCARVALYGLMLLAGLILLLVNNTWEIRPEWLMELPVVTLGTLPAVVAFFIIIAEGRAFEEHAHSYAQAHSLFAEAKRQAELLDPADAAGWRQLLLALGQEALVENATWIHTHRARPVASRVT